MTVHEPIYRARVYVSPSVDPTETTLLQPIAGALHSEAFAIATAQGVAGYQPYMAIPKGRRGRLDFQSKKSDIGSRTITLVDVMVDPSTSTNAERWASQFWGDQGARTVLNGLRYEEDESLDGGLTWDRLYTGRITDVKTVGSLQVQVAIRDLMDQLDQDLFLTDPIGVDYARRLPILPLGLTAPWNILLPSAPLLIGEVSAPTTGQPYTFRCGQDLSNDRDMLGHIRIPAALANLSYRTDTLFVGGRKVFWFGPKIAQPPSAETRNPPRVRVVAPGDVVSWWWLRALICEPIDTQHEDTTHWRPMVQYLDEAAELNGGTLPAWPAAGTDITWSIYHGSTAVTDVSPILIDDVDPVTFLADIVDGRFSRPHQITGDPIPLATRDPVSWATLAGQLPGVWRGLIKAKAPARTWTAEYICQLFQVGLTMNALGECVLLDLRRGENADGLSTIPASEIVSDPDAQSYQQSGKDAITRIIAPTDYVSQLDREEDFGRLTDQFPDVPPGMLRFEEVPDQYSAIGDLRTLDFGDKPTTIRLNGLAMVIRAGEGVDLTPAFFGYHRRVKTTTQRLVDDIFALFSHGPDYFTLVCRRVGVAETTVVGTRRLVAGPKLPNPALNLRGGTRVGLCIERTENGPTVTLAFVGLGYGFAADPPTFPAPPDLLLDSCTSITVPITLNAAGDPVIIEWAATAIGDPRPGDDDERWTYGARLTASGTATLTGLPSGSRIHLRVRSVPL